MTNYTNFVTITNFVTQTNFITETNFITQTNTVTSLSDPALWVTIVASTLTAISAFLMWKSVLEMKKQNKQSHNNSVIMALIQYDQQLISATDDGNRCLVEIIKNKDNDKDSHGERLMIKLSSILSRVIIIYYSKLCENNNDLKHFFNELINPSIEAMISGFIYYYYKISKESGLKIHDALLIQYCEEQKIKIPNEILKK